MAVALGFCFASVLGSAALLSLGLNLEDLQFANWETVSQLNINIYKFVQVLLTVGLFVLPAVLFSRWQTGDERYLRLLPTVRMEAVVLAVLITVALLPLMSGLGLWNQSLELPAAFQGLEATMRQMETEALELTVAFLQMRSPFDFLLNLFVIAILPALGEELLFRGCLQPVLQRLTNSPHLGIWLAAAVFSFIHFQFYGFLPRLLLGALFGYLFYWSGNLWYPMIAHFLNNGLQVALVYVGVLSVENMDAPEQALPVLAVAASAVVGLLLSRQYYHLFHQPAR